MSGKRIAELLERWNAASQPFLTDDEMVELEKGLAVLCEFFHASKLSPLTVYYEMKLESVQHALQARRAR
jgi:hypothetical protein